MGALMTTTQAIFFGIMVALAPGVLLTILFWRDESGLGEDKEPDLEFDDRPPYPRLDSRIQPPKPDVAAAR